MLSDASLSYLETVLPGLSYITLQVYKLDFEPAKPVFERYQNLCLSSLVAFQIQNTGIVSLLT